MLISDSSCIFFFYIFFHFPPHNLCSNKLSEPLLWQSIHGAGYGELNIKSWYLRGRFGCVECYRVKDASCNSFKEHWRIFALILSHSNAGQESVFSLKNYVKFKLKDKIKQCYFDVSQFDCSLVNFKRPKSRRLICSEEEVDDCSNSTGHPSKDIQLGDCSFHLSYTHLSTS